MHSTTDAVIIGGGINAMVAAAELSGAGWSVTLIERNQELGGFIASGERTLPGYVHDTYSSWHPLFLAGPAYASLGADLHRHGLEYRNTDGYVTASVDDDGNVAIAHRDPERTAAGFEHAADRAFYLASLDRFVDNVDRVGSLLGTELHSWSAVRQGLGLLRSVGRRSGESWARDVLTSGRSWCRNGFAGTEVDQLWTPWLLHAGLSPDHASGGFMLPVLAATVHGFGLPVVAGGAGNFVAAFRGLLEERGVQIVTGLEVDSVQVARKRAVGVSAGPHRWEARRAVLASVAPRTLYHDLLRGTDMVSATTRLDAQRYRAGRGEMQIHVALSSPLAWKDQRLSETPLIHISDGSRSTGIACAEAEAGLLPRQPTVVVGQQYLLDPSRVPPGAASLWLQLQEVPYSPAGDASGKIDTSAGWTPDTAAAYAERVLDRIEQHAPDLRAKVLAVDIVTPVDLERYNPNAIYGDPYGGSAELDQNFLWRPLPSAGSHRTQVQSLWHIGAATHPGPGLGGGSGHLVAQELTTSRNPFRLSRSKR
ncbi:phytoene desaturase family protein [Nocardioides luteus]|uniref:phytoene desaturase family protein n=1 Tax=Nocardioides luteus TaxID=1844 RepID=UPI0018CB2C2A|nr:NAD(P)/FAD-dependent oxidoreductase [Nocardioides luteus]MBG6096825.1 phytoene dehydrogenase-like protein [Nocardioides luteus]